MTQPPPDRRRARATPAPNPQRLSEVRGRARHLAVGRTLITIVVTWVLLGAAYFALPGASFSGWRELVRLTSAMAVVGVVFVTQARSVQRAAMPELRAVQALGVVIPLFLLVFALTYLSLSHSNVGSFSEPLDHGDAIYFTVTVFATVGFGDIAPLTLAARMTVSVQMLLDLIILGFVVRVIFGAARSAFERRGEGTDEAAS